MAPEPQGLEPLSVIAPGVQESLEAQGQEAQAVRNHGLLLSPGRLRPRETSSAGSSVRSWREDEIKAREHSSMKQVTPSMTVQKVGIQQNKQKKPVRTSKSAGMQNSKRQGSLTARDGLRASDSNIKLIYHEPSSSLLPTGKPIEHPWAGKRWVPPSPRNPRAAPTQRWFSFTKDPPEAVGMRVHGCQKYGEAYSHYDMDYRFANGAYRDISQIAGSTDRWMSRMFMGSLELHQRMAVGAETYRQLSGLPTNIREAPITSRKSEGNLRRLNVDMVTVSPMIEPGHRDHSSVHDDDENGTDEASVRQQPATSPTHFPEVDPHRTGWSADGNPRPRTSSRSPIASPRNSDNNSPRPQHSQISPRNIGPSKSATPVVKVPTLKIYDGLLLSKQPPAAKTLSGDRVRAKTDSARTTRPVTVRTKPYSRGWKLDYDEEESQRDPKLKKAVQLGEMLLSLHTAASPKEVALSVQRIIGSMIDKSDTIIMKRTSMNTLSRYVGDTLDSWETPIEIGRGIVGSVLSSRKPHFREFYANENSLDRTDEQLGIRALGAVYAASFAPPPTEGSSTTIPFGVLVVQKTFGIFSVEERDILKVIRDHATTAMIAQGESTSSKGFKTGTAELSPLQGRSKAAIQKKLLEGDLSISPTPKGHAGSDTSTFLTQQPRSPREWGPAPGSTRAADASQFLMHTNDAALLTPT